MILTTGVSWNNGHGFASFEGATLRLRAAPPGFDGALSLNYTPGGAATVRFYGARERNLTDEERDNLMCRLVSLSCGAWDGWEKQSPTLVVVFPPGVKP